MEPTSSTVFFRRINTVPTRAVTSSHDVTSEGYVRSPGRSPQAVTIPDGEGVRRAPGQGRSKGKASIAPPVEQEQAIEPLGSGSVWNWSALPLG
jgi:hypothetical protein